MAIVIIGANDVFTGGSTWKAAATGTNAATPTATSANTNTTTSYVWSSAFTVDNAQTIDAVLVNLKRLGTTGTVTVALSDDNGVTATRSVTVNVSALPPDYSWVMFKFDSTLASDGGTDYKVGVTHSVGGSGANVLRDGTAGNWGHVLRTTGFVSIAANDSFMILGELDSSSVLTARTCTMDSTATTSYGGTLGLCWVGWGGTLSFAYSASTNYYLKLAASLWIDCGSLTVGTEANPIPSTSTATLHFACSSSLQYFINATYASIVFYGAAIRSKWWSILAADVTSNSTSITLADSVDWKNNDSIAIAGTKRTVMEHEVGQVNGDVNNSTTVNVKSFAGSGGGVAYGHMGNTTTKQQAAVINLTRNVVFRGESSGSPTYIYMRGSATSFIARYTAFNYFGGNSDTKYGIDFRSDSAGYVNIQDCAAYMFWQFYRDANASAGGPGYLRFQNNVAYGSGDSVYVGGYQSPATHILSDCVAIGVNNTAFSVKSPTQNVSNLRASNMTNYYGLEMLGNWIDLKVSNIVVHSTGTRNGIYVPNTVSLFRSLLEDIFVWRVADAGVRIECGIWICTFNRVICRGCTNQGFLFVTTGDLVMYDCQSGADDLPGGFTQSNGLYLWNGGSPSIKLYNCDFGYPATNSNADVIFNTCARVDILFSWCSFNSATPFSGWSSSTVWSCSVLRFQGYNKNATDHRLWRLSEYNIQSEGATFRTSSPSEKVIPVLISTAVYQRVQSSPKQKAVDSGNSATFSVYVRIPSTPSKDFAPHNLQSNTSAPGITISTSSQHASWPAWMAYDSSLSNVWITNGTPTAWHQIQFSGTAKTLYKYGIRFYAGGGELARAPKNWTMKGSNNGTDWTTIDTVTNSTGWGNGEYREFFCDDVSTAYNYFRLDITANNGDGTYTQLSEIFLWEASALENPRLMIRRNPSCGIDSDVVLATHSGALNTWELLTGESPQVDADGVLEAYVDGPMDSGCVLYVDDWA